MKEEKQSMDIYVKFEIENQSDEVYTKIEEEKQSDDVYVITDEEEAFNRFAGRRLLEGQPEDKIIQEFLADHEPQIFPVEFEDGTQAQAELLQVVEIDGKEYAIYSVPSEDPFHFDILASYVVKDEEGYDQLKDLDDPVDKSKIYNYVLSLMK